MTLDVPKNLNYAAYVVRVRKINPLANCDNVVGVPLLGYQAITTKDVQLGDLGIVFTAETQLSLVYATANNLHRHEHLNYDPSPKGYLEDNRRVRALKFRGHRSDALFMPLSSLSYFGIDVSQLKEGDVFDTIDGHEICRKYVVPRRGANGLPAAKQTKPERVDEKLFPPHFDTANYFRTPEAVTGADHVVITQKLHGTSVRIGHALVQRKLTWWDKVAKFFGAKVQEREYDYLYGSRKVVKDPGNESTGYYEKDLWTIVGKRLEGLLPKGYIVYGEIVGWVPDTSTPIQKGYTYRIPEGCGWLFVYRITTVNEDGRAVDLSWPAVKEFCESIGVDTVPELYTGPCVTEDFVNYFLDKRLVELPLYTALPTEGITVDEGVCLRVEGLTPTIVKAKSPEFLRYETKLLDNDVVDMEAEEVTV